MAKSLKIDAGLWKRVEERAAAEGYSSAEEFVVHLLEKELAQRDEAAGEAERRLRGLGYLE